MKLNLTCPLLNKSIRNKIRLYPSIVRQSQVIIHRKEDNSLISDDNSNTPSLLFPPLLICNNCTVHPCTLHKRVSLLKYSPLIYLIITHNDVFGTTELDLRTTEEPSVYHLFPSLRNHPLRTEYPEEHLLPLNTERVFYNM